jgi:ferredoxin
LFGQGPFVLTGDSGAVRWIFSQPRSAFAHFNDQLGVVLGDRSVLFMDGEEHRRERHLPMPVFHGGRIRSCGAIMREAAGRELARWPRHDTVIVQPGMARITLEVICKCLSGQADGAHSERLAHHAERFADTAATPALPMAGTVMPRTRIRVLLQRRKDVPLPVRLLSSVPRTLPWREAADSREKTCQAADAEIAACRAGDPRYEGTILKMLTAAKDEAGTGLTDQETRRCAGAANSASCRRSPRDRTCAASSWPRTAVCHYRPAPGRPPEMNLKVTVEHGKCPGTGSCVMLAPEHFQPGADGKALVRCDGGGAGREGTLTGLTQAQSGQVREAAMFQAAYPGAAGTVRRILADDQVAGRLSETHPITLTNDRTPSGSRSNGAFSASGTGGLGPGRGRLGVLAEARRRFPKPVRPAARRWSPSCCAPAC